MRHMRLLVIFLLPVYLLSCSPKYHLSKYLGDVTDSTGKNIVIPDLTIQRNDLLSIQVYSASTKPGLTDAMYNLPCAAIGAQQSGQGLTPCGFLVDANGNIEYPQIGLLKVQGLSKSQLSDLIRFKINEKDSVLTNPSVIVRFLNLKVTVIGEVRAPGVRSFPGERITILEAIGLAGDLTENGVKERVKVVREVNGQRQTGVLDLSSPSLFDSPFYNLMQNDIVVVDPSNRQTKQAQDNQTYQRISLGLSIVTSLALLYNIFK